MKIATVVRTDTETARKLALITAWESLLDTVWRCERWEIEHPYTVATIRSLARVRSSESR